MSYNSHGYRGGADNTEDDERMARRLQYEEQSRTDNRGSRSGGGRGYSQQEQSDMELARQYAEMDLGASSDDRRKPAPTYHQRTRSGSADDDCNRSVLRWSRNRSTSPQPTNPSVDPFDYGSKSPRRYSSNLASTGSREHQYESPGHRRRNTVSERPSEMFYERSFEGHRRQSTGSPHRTTESPQRRSFVSPRKPSQSMSLRLPLSSPERSESLSAASQSYHQRSSSRGGTQDMAGHHGFAGEPPLKMSSAGVPMEYARQLQLAGVSNGQQHGGNASPHSATDTDAELARKMQALEDRGMGRVNSDRDIDVAKMASFDEVPPSRSTTSSPVTSQNNDELARLITESGTSLNDISDEVLRELLGSTAAKQLQLAASDPTAPVAASTGLHPNSPSIRALRSALSGVDRADIERRASKLDRSDIRRVNSSSTPQPKSRSVARATAVEPRPTSEQASAVAKPISSPLIASAVVLEEVAPPSPSKKKKSKRRGFLAFAQRTYSRDSIDGSSTSTRKAPPGAPSVADVTGGIPAGIPAAIPPPPGGSLSVPPIRSKMSNRQNRSVSPPTRSNGGVPSAIVPPSAIPGGIPAKPIDVRHSRNGSFRGTSMCSACGLSHGTFLKVFDRKFHPECFRCSTCDGKIDPNDQFKYTTDDDGQKHPHHRECFMSFGVNCTVCKQTIPATPDGRVPFIKHPFFESEQMCVRHADEPFRRCSGCQRFEPRDTPFIDLMDGNRCVCSACCRSVVVDNADVKPLWRKLMSFFQNHLKIPVWGAMRDIDILVVGSEMLKEQMLTLKSVHSTASSVPNVAGLCLTEETPSGTSSPSSSHVIGILCLTGLPRDLAAGVLAHEAAHAWLKLHPKYDARNPLPPQVEEGVAQLIAVLFLSDGLDPVPTSTSSTEGPSDAKLRQYFQFSIEREKDEIYGTGYRRAAMAYRDIGIEALLTHILQYRDFPMT